MSLPGFSNNTSVVRFNPNFVYHRRKKEAPTMNRPPDLLPTSSPHLATGSSRHPSLRRSTRISLPLGRYGFSHTSLMATLSSSSIPQSYSQAVQH